jgi:ABC-type proline/glycine betaine transport system permease subunit
MEFSSFPIAGGARVALPPDVTDPQRVLVYVLPTSTVLVLLTVPPILTGTYAGIQTANPDAVGAANFSTATIAAYLGLQGLRRFILDGTAASKGISKG